MVLVIATSSNVILDEILERLIDLVRGQPTRRYDAGKKSQGCKSAFQYVDYCNYNPGCGEEDG